MTDTCATCRFFRESRAEPVEAARGECRRYPGIPWPVRRSWWCGEYQAVREYSSTGPR